MRISTCLRTSLSILFLTSLLVSLVQAQAAYPPGLMFSTLLNGVKVDYRRGIFSMENIQATFLPEAESSSIYAYNPDDGGKLKAVIRTKDGTQIEVATFYGQKLEKVFWLLNSYQLQGCQPHEFKLPGDGEYVLDFYVEGSLFHRFPFALVSVGSDDPYNPEKTWHLEGAWNDYGYLYYRDADPTMTPMFKLWMSHKGNLQQARDMKIDAQVVRLGDGTVVCNCPTLNVRSTPNWVRYELSFVDPNNGQIFRAERLLEKDGAYEVRVTEGGKPYGTYSFQIKDGKIVHQGRANRQGTDPLVYIEGGPDAWWLRRKEAPPEDVSWLIKTATPKLE